MKLSSDFRNLFFHFFIYFRKYFTEFLLCISIFVAFLFRGFVASSDGASSWFSPFYNLKENFFVWNTYSVPGSSAPNSFTSFFLRLFYSGIASLTENPAIVQKLTWIFFFQIFGFIVFVVLRRAFLLKKLDALLGTWFIIFNPIAQYFLWEKQHWAYYLTVVYFLSFAFYKKYFDTKNVNYLYAISILWFINGYAFNQPAYFAICGVFMFIMLLWNFFTKQEKRKVFIDNLKFLVFFLLLNLVYLLPLIIGGSAQIQNVQSKYAGGDPIPILHDLSSVNFFYSLIDITKGYNRFYSTNPLVVYLWTAFIVIVIFSVFFKRRFFSKNDFNYILISCVFFVILIFLNKGISIPFQRISEQLYLIKIMYLFRDFKDKLALGYSLVLSIFFVYLIKLKGRYLKIFFGLISVLSYASFASNYWLPNNFQFSDSLSYLKEANITHEAQSRVLNLPLVNYSFYYTEQPYYSGDNPLKNIFQKEVLYTTNQIDGGTAIVKKMLDTGVMNEQYFELYLKNNNIEYVLNNKNSFVKEDVNQKAYNFRILQNVHYLELVQENDRFQLYKFIDYFPRVLGRGIKFEQISPVEYRVSLTGLKDEEVISFLDMSDSAWNMYILKSDTPNSCPIARSYVAVDTDECVKNTGFLSSLFPRYEALTSLLAKKIIPKFEIQNSEFLNNEWKLNTALIKKTFNKEYYSVNSDGSLNLELDIYLLSQIYFLIGLITSTFVLFFFTVYKIWYHLLRKERY